MWWRKTDNHLASGEPKDRRKSSDRLDTMRLCRPEPTSYFDLSPEVSTATQQLTKLLVHK